MHRIIKSHLDNFAKSFEIADLDENTQFEMFANYAVISPRVGAEFQLEDITTGDGDDGMDGVAVLIDEEVIVSADDVSYGDSLSNYSFKDSFLRAECVVDGSRRWRGQDLPRWWAWQ